MRKNGVLAATNFNLADVNRDNPNVKNIVILISGAGSNMAAIVRAAEQGRWAERLNARGLAKGTGLSRFLGFLHTEGCGFGGETMYQLLHRTYRGYLTHPNVASALLLEHGCEKVPNDVMRHHLAAAGVDPARFGWASVQLDGGIERALGRVEAWFEERLAAAPAAAALVPQGAPNLALLSAGPVDDASSRAFAAVARAVLAAGGDRKSTRLNSSH